MNQESKILIVEDNPSLSEILRKIVQSEGYIGRPVHTGREALKILREDGPFDLVLLDVMLPDPLAPVGGGMDGLEVCQEIKSDPELSDTMIFLVTVKDQPDDIMRGIDAGADDYITKPFNTTLLLAKIKAMLRIKNLSMELQSPALQENHPHGIERQEPPTGGDGHHRRPHRDPQLPFLY